MEEDKDKKEDGSQNSVKLEWKKLALIGLIPLFAIFISYIVAVRNLGTEKYADIINWFSEHFGLVGVFLYAYIVDTLILPLSPDLVWPIVASLDWYIVIPLIGGASALGGITSFFIGVLFDKIPFIRRMTESANRKWGPYISVYGSPFLSMAALFPLPYSTICTVAGAVHMPIRKALPSILLRFVHAAVYFALFRAGLLLM